MDVRNRTLVGCCGPLLLVAVAALAACGKDNGNQQQKADPGAGTYKLALLGAPALQLHPNDKRTLQVVLAQDQVGPVKNARILFTLNDGDAAGAQLANASVTTDATGVAPVKFTAGSITAAGGFKVVASAPDYPDARPVAFSVSVIQIRRFLEIIGTPNVKVSSDGQSAQVSMYISSSTPLKVKERDRDTGNAIAGDMLDFAIGSGVSAGFSGASPKSSMVATNTAGEAQVYLLSTAQTETFTVTGASGEGGTGALTFSVAVNTNAVGAGCTSSQQCPAGQICQGGVCTTDGGGSCGGGSDTGCPFGYTCIGGVCQPPANTTCDPNLANCPSGQYCDCSNPTAPATCACAPICPVCTAGTHCDPTGHTCVPDLNPTPDVSGVWYVKHIYALDGALPAAVQDIFVALRVIDQALSGALGLPSWLQAILSGIIDQYVPVWVRIVVRIGDSLGTLLSNLRSVGAMRLAQGGSITQVKGSEVWTSLVFYFLPQCCPQGPLDGNCPALQGDPTEPLDCARFDVATTDSDNPGDVGQCKGQSIPAITVKVLPFQATVVGSGANSDKAPWTLNVSAREVDLRMGKVVLVVIDTLLSLFTPWHCIDEATDCSNGQPCIVDCASIAQSISDLTGGFLDEPTLEAVCDGAVTAIGQQLTAALAKVAFDVDTLDFSGHAKITGFAGDGSASPAIDNSTCDSGSLCANQLGADDFDKQTRSDAKNKTNNRDGNWEGSFFLRSLNHMPGGWEGKRNQIQ